MIFSFYKIITNNKVRVLLLALCITVFSTQFSDNLKTRIGVISDNADRISENNFNSSLGYRYMWFKIGVDNIFKAPLLGLGAGSYKNSTIDYFNQQPTQDVDHYVTNNPHNEFLSISSQLGSVGLFLFFGFLFFLFKDSSNDILSRGVFVVVVVSSLFNSAFYDNMLGLFIVILVCLSSQDKFIESIEIK
jgi:O-antigen ligase